MNHYLKQETPKISELVEEHHLVIHSLKQEAVKISELVEEHRFEIHSLKQEAVKYYLQSKYQIAFELKLSEEFE